MHGGKFNTSAVFVNTSFGNFNNPVGKYNTTVGEFNISFGNFNISFGEYNTSVGDFNTLVGNFNTPVGEYSTSVGDFNTPVGASKTTWISINYNLDAFRTFLGKSCVFLRKVAKHLCKTHKSLRKPKFCIIAFQLPHRTGNFPNC